MDDAATCWVCCEGGDSPHGTPLSTGCACRGSAGHAHLQCLVSSARTRHEALPQLHPERLQYWHSCPTCKQGFTGAVLVGLARAHYELVHASPHGGRIDAASMLAIALNQAGDFAGARPLFEEVVAGTRQVYGNDHASTLNAITNLATHLSRTGARDRESGAADLESARKLQVEAVSTYSRTGHTTRICMYRLAALRATCLHVAPAP